MKVSLIFRNSLHRLPSYIRGLSVPLLRSHRAPNPEPPLLLQWLCWSRATLPVSPVLLATLRRLDWFWKGGRGFPIEQGLVALGCNGATTGCPMVWTVSVAPGPDLLLVRWPQPSAPDSLLVHGCNGRYPACPWRSGLWSQVSLRCISRVAHKKQILVSRVAYNNFYDYRVAHKNNVNKWELNW